LDASVKEVLDLVVRWIHIIAGIMWIGNSMLFNWLDRNLVRKTTAGPNQFGDIWLLHSGAYYQVEKKLLTPAEMPEILHWFKWQSYTTWMTGFALLVLVYYLGGGAFLVDPRVSGVSVNAAIGIGLGTVFGGFIVYDLLCRSKLPPHVLSAICVALVGGVAYGLSQLLSGRAAYMHVGAMLGTIMAGNVFMHIIPSQKELVGATQRGEPPSHALSQRAKFRSIHNNYITFPMLFLMISNHFSSFYSHHFSWVLLLVLMTGGALVRHFMNIRFVFPSWRYGLASTIAVTIGLLFFVASRPAPGVESEPVVKWTGAVTFKEVNGVIQKRCVTCHSANPADVTFGKNPSGVTFDDPSSYKKMAERIKVRAVDTKTMPPANKTGITPEERDLLDQWIAKGAPLE